MRGAPRRHGAGCHGAAGLPHHQRLQEAPLAALAGLFLQVLALCRQAGLVQLGRVALDRTKIKANASKHKAMKAKDGFVQACNAQAAVDAHAQIAVACTLTNNAADQAVLGPLLDPIAAGLGGSPKEISADVGYCSEADLETLAARGIRGYVATGRQKHPATGAAQRRGPLVDAMRTRLGRAGRRTRYRLRKQTVEPVIGPIKQARGFRQFLRRGLAKVSAEWALICTAPNPDQTGTGHRMRAQGGEISPRVRISPGHPNHTHSPITPTGS